VCFDASTGNCSCVDARMCDCSSESSAFLGVLSGLERSRDPQGSTLMRNRRLIVNPTLARQEQALLRMRLESCRSPAASTDKASAPHSESPALAAVAAGQYLPAVCEPSMVHSPCSDPRPVAADVGDVLAAGRGMERGDVQWWREEEECGDRAGVWKVYMVDGSDNGGQAGAERSREEDALAWRGSQGSDVLYHFVYSA
jgi:hypothetical protein